MTIDSNNLPKMKNNSPKSVNNNTNEIIDKDSTLPAMNDLERLLSSHKLKHVNTCAAGFSKIAAQLCRRSVRTGFQFNLMVVGCSGLGKSSFLNTLFYTQFPENTKTCFVTENVFNLSENEVNLTLKLIEVPKFGDKLNNSKCWKSVDSYLDACFENQITTESKINRTDVNYHTDPLVHVCLYFIQPRSDKVCLNEVDLEFLNNIHHKVNIVPLIAKSDMMNPRELGIHKQNLLNELNSYGIRYFQFKMPEDSGWRAESTTICSPDRKFIQSLIDRFPFGVVAGNEVFVNDKEQMLVRSYPWGNVEVDNLAHSDTSAVRTLLLSTHMQELIQYTYNEVYENYRFERLNELCGQLGIGSENRFHPAVYLEKYFKLMDISLNNKINEMEAGFQDLVQARESALEKKTKELDEISQALSDELNQSLMAFDSDFSRFITEKTQWDCDNIEYHETYGTMKISRNGRLKPISKLKKLKFLF